ncbi:hypothetical protein EGW08_012156, partial [Elysia chlorotica]
MESPMKPLPPSNGPRPHRCEVCQRSFREIATLRKHEQLHRADRPYVCTTCGKSFLWSSNLKVHERVHTGERPYKCKICHRCFTQSNDLRRHERNVHMRGKLYGYKTGRHTAQHCNIFFYDYTMFHLHESLHMPYEDHPFRCPSCGTHCQDKIEFMFHTVWHVKYPHTIPNYTPFREGFLA